MSVQKAFPLAVALVVSSLAVRGEEPRTAPKNPEQPFLVFVAVQNERDDAVREAKSELDERLQRNEKWFRVVDVVGDAEIVVRLRSYWSREEKQVMSVWGVISPVEGSQPDKTQIVEIVSHHRLQAEVDFFGVTKTMTAAKQKKNGGSVKDAAREMAKELERHCKENYWSLVKRRSTGS